MCPSGRQSKGVLYHRGHRGLRYHRSLFFRILTCCVSSPSFEMVTTYSPLRRSSIEAGLTKVWPSTSIVLPRWTDLTLIVWVEPLNSAPQPTTAVCHLLRYGFLHLSLAPHSIRYTTRNTAVRLSHLLLARRGHFPNPSNRCGKSTLMCRIRLWYYCIMPIECQGRRFVR